jgi:hypothetical protein
MIKKAKKTASRKTNDNPPSRSELVKKSTKAGITAVSFVKKLETFRSPIELKKYHRFFDFDEVNPGKGDVFIGVRMGHVFNLAKEFLDMPPAEIEKLLESRVHEVRAGGCSIMGKQCDHKNTSRERKRELYNLYLRRHDRINDWDLVDLASYKVVGRYLFESGKSRAILYKLAGSKNTWERRTSIVSTAYFIRKGEVADAFAISEILADDKEDTVNKATGWMLRYAGDKDRPALLDFLNKYGASMPRILLRNAIEKLDKKQRDYFLNLKNVK